MLDAIYGKVEEIQGSSLILSTESGFVFNIIVNPSLFSEGLISIGSFVKIYTHIKILTINPDIRLYGFVSKQEREIFLKIVSVKGVGAGIAMRILASGSFDEIKEAINKGDEKHLKSVKGVGPKMAKNIAFYLAGSFRQEESLSSKGKDEVIKGLIALGYKDKEIYKKMEKYSNEDFENPQNVIVSILRSS